MNTSAVQQQTLEVWNEELSDDNKSQDAKIRKSMKEGKGIGK